MNRVYNFLICAILICIGCNDLKENENTQSNDDEERIKVISQSQEVSDEINQFLRNEINKSKSTGAPPSRCPGPFPIPIAVSVYGTTHISSGVPVWLEYPYTRTNEGSPGGLMGGFGWDGSTQFAAPCDGLYHFSISFVKDSYYFQGTTDDVNVYFVKLPATGASGVRYGNAWSGEGDGRRGTGTDNIILRLKEGDNITTWVYSDGGPKRHLAYYSLNIHRIAN
ncbi:MAG: hypothetical protein IPL55_07970 [Saprospiraceae bacterium]|nr:hypothetical protein [Saprospiraceae bacterium]